MLLRTLAYGDILSSPPLVSLLLHHWELVSHCTHFRDLAYISSLYQDLPTVIKSFKFDVVSTPSMISREVHEGDRTDISSQRTR